GYGQNKDLHTPNRVHEVISLGPHGEEYPAVVEVHFPGVIRQSIEVQPEHGHLALVELGPDIILSAHHHAAVYLIQLFPQLDGFNGLGIAHGVNSLTVNELHDPAAVGVRSHLLLDGPGIQTCTHTVDVNYAIAIGILGEGNGQLLHGLPVPFAFVLQLVRSGQAGSHEHVTVVDPALGGTDVHVALVASVHGDAVGFPLVAGVELPHVLV